eukprot:GHVL01012736.1.p1 GENE.GHVL01012736.1~~GHVL01012736.1.p1  ORF type:complete len:113 (-),score=13.77 GHVL01012736.1:25-330(-)
MPSGNKQKFSNEGPGPLRKPHFPYKTLFLAIFLFTIGSIFIVIGCGKFFIISLSESIPMILLGCLTFMPGFYQIFMIVQVFRNAPGYDISMIDTCWDDRIE